MLAFISEGRLIAVPEMYSVAGIFYPSNCRSDRKAQCIQHYRIMSTVLNAGTGCLAVQTHNMYIQYTVYSKYLQERATCSYFLSFKIPLIEIAYRHFFIT